ncbi:YciI family protein [Profundibacter sp.]
MLVCLIAIDKPDALQIRMDNREAHLAYVSETGVVDLAGPFLDADGNMCGSLLILNVGNMSEAETWAENDPYTKAGLFQSTTLREWKKVIG